MENQLSQAQTNLIECLKFLKINQEEIVAIMLMIPKDEQIAEMAEFLLNNPEATQQEIMEKALEISEL